MTSNPKTNKLMLHCALLWCSLFASVELIVSVVSCGRSEYVDSFFLDAEVKEPDHFIKLLKSQISDPAQFYLFCHSRPGELLISGQWMNSNEIASWLKKEDYLKGKRILSIYGRNFAKGIKGKKAVEHLAMELGVSIAASNDITAIVGD